MRTERTIEQIEADNAAFEVMSPEQKRVQIAKDVLAQLDAKRLVAARGVWLCQQGDTYLAEIICDVEDIDELREEISNASQCTACAIGGLFMTAVERDTSNARDAELNTAIEDNDHMEYLSTFFDWDQLGAIETAFEQGCGAHTDDEFPEAAAFASEVVDSEQRMRLIMQNIISNNGTFIP